MKKWLITMLFIMVGLFGYSQPVYKSYDVVAIDTDVSVPRYLVGYTDNTADTIGIVLTIEQAMKVDNYLDLLDIYKRANNNCDSTINFLVQVVDDYKKMDIIVQQTYKAYQKSILDLKSQISNLNNRIKLKDEQILLKDEIITNKDNIITLDSKKIKQLKKQKGILMTGGVAIGVGLLYMIIGHPGIK
jgi:hypothetical protein